MGGKIRRRNKSWRRSIRIRRESEEERKYSP
jgi:hypothetical protein